MNKKTWADYPYQFKPEKTLSLDEMTRLMHFLFGMKGFPEEFYNSLPEDLRQHFFLRENVYERPKFVESTESND